MIGIDNPLAASLTTHDLRARVVTCGLDPNASLRATNLRFAGFGSEFDVVDGDRTIGRIRLRVPGAMNVQNALAAIAIGVELGLPFASIAAA